MTIHYTEHGALVGVSTNMNVVPRIGDKIKVILVKEYDKTGRVIDYKFELPTI